MKHSIIFAMAVAAVTTFMMTGNVTAFNPQPELPGASMPTPDHSSWKPSSVERCCDSVVKSIRDGQAAKIPSPRDSLKLQNNLRTAPGIPGVPVTFMEQDGDDDDGAGGGGGGGGGDDDEKKINPGYDVYFGMSHR